MCLSSGAKSTGITPTREAQSLKMHPNCLALNCWILLSSTGACPVALLCPKRSATTLPVAHSMTSELLPPTCFTTNIGANRGQSLFVFGKTQRWPVSSSRNPLKNGAALRDRCMHGRSSTGLRLFVSTQALRCLPMGAQ